METRRELFVYGNLPFAATLPHIETTTALVSVLSKLLQVATRSDGQPSWFVKPSSVAELLDIPITFAEVLCDTVEAVAPADTVVRKDDMVDVHALVLYLFAQLYTRSASRPGTKDIWPSTHDSIGGGAGNSGSGFHMQLEPSSPVRMSNKGSSAGGTWPSNFVRQHLQQHQVQQQHVVQGFVEFIQRHTVNLLLLCMDTPPTQQDNLTTLHIKAHEFSRLHFLLDPGPGGPASMHNVEPSLTTAEGTPLLTLSAWVTLHVHDTLGDSSGGAGPSGTSLLDTPASPPAAWPPSPSSSTTDDDVAGLHKTTVARGPGSCSRNQVRISDCHDATIYLLAPLECVSISCCSDCIVVVGAVGKLLRVERCVRLQLIAVCKRIYINASHDCIFYLGTNQPPVLLGDNRFVQFAPFNSHYEFLPEHMAAAGITPGVSHWNEPVVLLHDATTTHIEQHKSPDSKSPDLRSKPTPAYSILPPEKLMPFVVPFRGGPGHLCGGPANVASLTRSDSIGSTVPGVANSAKQQMFPLPPEYEAAVQKKQESVAKLRSAVKSANLSEERKREVQSVIQSYFREWLTSSGRMRSVYDLARLEKQDGDWGYSGGGSSSKSG